MTNAHERSAQLETQLRAELKKDPVSLASVLSGAETAYAMNPRLLVAGHFEFQARALINAPKLGVLGIVQWIDSPASAESDLRRHIDQATYLRRLLLEQAEVSKRAAYSVELVVDPGPAMLDVLGGLLRKVSRDTDFLYHIGLHLAGDAAALNRALSWLMRETSSWFTAHQGGESKLASIELDRYRMPAKRKWQLDMGARIHVIHGHNGTGKSSLTESIELVMTGTADRLKNKQNLGEIIWPRSQQPATQITIGYRDGSKKEYTVNQRLDPGPLAPELCGDSFRLDQALMDRLSRLDPARRAETFLTAYFPDAHPVFVDAAKARAQAQASLAQIPSAMRRALESKVTKDTTIEEVLIAEYKWTEDASAPVPREAKLACVPLPPETLQDLAPIDKTLPTRTKNLLSTEMWVSTLISELQELDAALKAIAKDASNTLLTIASAKQALSRIRDWHPSPSQVPQGDFKTVLDEWLDLDALVDLGTKRLAVALILSAAKEKGWTERGGVPAFADMIFSLEELDSQGHRLQAWTDEHERLFKLIMASSAASDTASSSSEPASITPAEISALDKAGQWLFETTDGRGFGQTIDDALRQNDSMRFANLSIGGKDWSGSTLDQLTSLERAVNSVWHHAKENWLYGGDLFNLFKNAQTHARAAREKAAEVSKVFHERISGKLNAAMNELLAIFAPARWAYKSLAMEQSLGTGTPELSLTTDGADATLRLNTAELNLFTVALFLLCAFGRPNPLQILLLDDPLQNMDELTVTTLARGLGRLIRVVPAGWNLVFLFHGEDDLERFRRELPCAVYRLPWLSPSTEEATSIDIVADVFLSVPNAQLQDLSVSIREWTGPARIAETQNSRN